MSTELSHSSTIRCGVDGIAGMLGTVAAVFVIAEISIGIPIAPPAPVAVRPAPKSNGASFDISDATGGGDVTVDAGGASGVGG